jgi:glycosyltransferase involved in cell wall biosynthesis
VGREESAEPGNAVIVTPELWGVTNENGGISTSVVHFARLLRGRGDRVTVLVGVAKEVEPDPAWARRFDADGLGVTVVPAARPRPAGFGAHGLEFPFRRISEAVAGAIPDDADVLYLQDWSALGFEYVRRRAMRRPKKPVTVTILRSSSEWIRSAREDRPPNAAERRLDFAERFAIEQSDFAVSPSRAYRDYLESRGVRLPAAGRTRILAHPWLPDGDRRAAVRSVRPGAPFRRLVFFGRLDTGKGLELFVDAVRLLRRERPEALAAVEELVFLGREGRHRYADLESVAREVRTLGLEAAFQTGLDTWEAERFLYDIVHEALVVIPSLRENFCNAVVEASLVPGLNVLCSNVGGIPEVLGGQGGSQLFAPDPHALASTLGQWLERGLRPASELRSYDWESANASWLRFHEELLARARATSPRPSPGSPAVSRPASSAVRLSVVVTTYEWPAALDAVLRALADQSDPDFEVVVADDGSGPETADVVRRWSALFADRLSHVWQPDEGYRLARVRDLGAAAARGAYLVFIDGDCIPRRHFIAAVRRAALPGWFLAGKRIELSRELSGAVVEKELPIGQWSLPALLLRRGRDLERRLDLTARDRRRPWRPALPDFTPHGNAYGFLTGLSRADFELVNGVDTRFVGWGEQDVDLATRLRRLGLRCGYAGPRATLLHLWHPPNVVRDRPTWRLLQETERSQRIEAVEGLRELVAELDSSSAEREARGPVELV